VQETSLQNATGRWNKNRTKCKHLEQAIKEAQETRLKGEKSKRVRNEHSSTHR
jgi:uncharacterized protein